VAGTIDGALRWWAVERAEHVALSCSGDSLTYADLDAWVGRTARFLDSAGLGAGDRLCVYAANGLEWCVTALATLRLGGIIAGINARMVTAEVAYLLGDYAPKILLIDAAGAERLADVGALASRTGEPVADPRRIDVAEIAALRAGAPEDVRRDLDPAVPAVIVTTSGSTARPKGVIYSNRSMLDYIMAYIIDDPIDAIHPKILVVAPLSTSAGFIQFTQAIVQGGSAWMSASFDPEIALDLIEHKRINIFCCPPIFFQRIAALPRFASADVTSIRIAHTGGAAVPVALLQNWAEKGVLVRQIYGQTECGGNAIVNPRRYAITHADKCGHGSAFKQIAIIDANGAFLPPGEPGQIVFRGAGMMLGYWNDPETTARTIVDGWLHTGDIGVIDELGLLRMIDRMKDIIISGGLNVSAAEVERVLLELPGIEEAAVVAAPDPKFGETPFAILFAASPIDVAEVMAHCTRNLSGFKLPRYVVFHDEPLPRLATGKISKPALRGHYLAGQSLPEAVR